jgi:hypothetical protein
MPDFSLCPGGGYAYCDQCRRLCDNWNPEKISRWQPWVEARGSETGCANFIPDPRRADEPA